MKVRSEKLGYFLAVVRHICPLRRPLLASYPKTPRNTVCYSMMMSMVVPTNHSPISQSSEILAHSSLLSDVEENRRDGKKADPLDNVDAEVDAKTAKETEATTEEKPTFESIPDQTAKSANEPATKVEETPVIESASEPVADANEAPADESATEKAAQTEYVPAMQSTSQPVFESAAKPILEDAIETVEEAPPELTIEAAEPEVLVNTAEVEDDKSMRPNLHRWKSL